MTGFHYHCFDLLFTRFMTGFCYHCFDLCNGTLTARTLLRYYARLLRCVLSVFSVTALLYVMSAAATSYGTPDRGLDIRRGGGLSPLREQFCTTYNLRPASGDTPEGYLPFVSRANLPSSGSHVDAALA